MLNFEIAVKNLFSDIKIRVTAKFSEKCLKIGIL